MIHQDPIQIVKTEVALDHRQLSQTMTISILLPTILGELQRHAIIVTQNCDQQKHPHYAVPMFKLIYPPYILYQNLYTNCLWGDTTESRCFRNSIRSYNSAFAFASLGVNEGMLQAGVYCFRVSSTVCHRIGHLQPNTDGEGAKFAQLYRYTCWQIVFIPRIALTTAKECHLPFTLTRRQFPVKPSYAMTIDKSQGQTMTKVGIYFPQFSLMVICM